MRKVLATQLMLTWLSLVVGCGEKGSGTPGTQMEPTDNVQATPSSQPQPVSTTATGQTAAPAPSHPSSSMPEPPPSGESPAIPVTAATEVHVQTVNEALTVISPTQQELQQAQTTGTVASVVVSPSNDEMPALTGETFQSQVNTVQPFIPGQTATIIQTVTANADLSDFSAGCWVPSDIAAASNPEGAQKSGPMAAGENWSIPVTINVPTDGYRREITCFTRGDTPQGIRGFKRTISLNPNGPLKATNETDFESRAPVRLTLTTDASPVPGSTVTVRLSAIPKVDHVNFSMNLDTEEGLAVSGVTISGGAAAQFPMAVKAGQTIVLNAKLSVPNDLTRRAFGGIARFGDSSNPDGAGLIEMETVLP